MKAYNLQIEHDRKSVPASELESRPRRAKLGAGHREALQEKNWLLLAELREMTRTKERHELLLEESGKSNVGKAPHYVPALIRAHQIFLLTTWLFAFATSREELRLTKYDLKGSRDAAKVTSSAFWELPMRGVNHTNIQTFLKKVLKNIKSFRRAAQVGCNTLWERGQQADFDDMTMNDPQQGALKVKILKAHFTLSFLRLHKR